MEKSQDTLSIYSASAGSGKTYTIAYEYISMMLTASMEQNKSYRNILAVTFTNKACDEMKSRIVLNLFLISNREKYSGKSRKSIDEIIGKIKGKTGLGESEIISRSRVFFSLILHDYSFFSIFTIDSFFQKIVRNLTYELGMQQNFELELDTNLVISQLVDDLMLESETDEDLRESIDALIDKNIDSDKKWSPKELIRNFVTQAILSDYKAGDTSSDEYVQYVDDIINSYSFAVKQCMVAIGNEISNQGLEEKDFTGGYANYYNYKLFANGNPNSSKYKQLIFDRFDIAKFKDEKWFNKKSSYSPDNFIQIIDKFKNDYDDEASKKFYTAFVIRKNIDLVRLLDKALGILHKNLERDAIFLLSDVPSMLSQIIEGAEDKNGSISVMPFVFEKVGTAYNNFLIDEFQDTSQKQWNIFYTMLSEALSQSNRSIIVGDIKQSIYSWRGGDWRILSNLASGNILKDYTKKEQGLDTNFRSVENIVNFNNDFFKSEYLADENNPDSKPNVFGSANKSLYDDVHQNVSKKGNSEVKVRFYNEDNEDEKINEEKIFKDMLSEIERLQLTYKVQPGQITILTRKKSEASFIANSFYAIPENERKQGVCYDVVSNEALYIASNPAVRLIIAYMRYLLNRNDLLSLTEASYLYYLERNKTTEVVEFNRTNLLETLENDINTKGFDLTAKQAFEIVDIIICRLHLNDNVSNVPFLVAFRNVVHDYSAKSTDLQAFIDYWDERGSSETLKIPESQNAIKIITIHASKGLEADYIFIPFCNWNFIDRIPGVVEYMFVKDPFSAEGMIPVENSSALEKTYFCDEYHDELYKKRIESYNLLYVAFTRAKSGLYISTNGMQKSEKDNKNKPQKIENVSHLLIDYFSKQHEGWNNIGAEGLADCVFVNGTLAEPKATDVRSEGNSFIADYPVNEGSDFEIVHHLRDDIEGEISAREKGNRYHAIFENINVVDDVEMAVNTLLAKGETEWMTAGELVSEIREKITNPTVADWYSGNCEVFNEFNIIVPDSKGEKLKRPDRVMVYGDEIVILDYKFGAEKYEEKYSDQVRRYASLISQIKGFENKKISMYIWYYFRNEIVKVGPSCDEGVLRI